MTPPDTTAVATIVGMATITYSTRTAGFLIAGRLNLAGRAKAAFDAIPAAVLVALIAPTILTSGPAEAGAALITCLAAARLPLLATIVIGVSSVVVLRAVLGV